MLNKADHQGISVLVTKMELAVSIARVKVAFLLCRVKTETGKFQIKNIDHLEELFRGYPYITPSNNNKAPCGPIWHPAGRG